MKRLLSRGLALVVALAGLAALVYVIATVADQRAFDDLRQGNYQTGFRVKRAGGDARTLQVGQSIQNRGDRSIEILEVRAFGFPAFRARIGPSDAVGPSMRLQAFAPFDLDPGRQREVRVIARFGCSDVSRDETVVVESFAVKYRVGFFDKSKRVALIERVRIGPRRARC